MGSYTTVIPESRPIESIQRGLADLGDISPNTNHDITITSVDTAKSVLIYRVTGSSAGGVHLVFARLQSATVIRAEVIGTTTIAGDIVIEWQVMEYK